MQFSAKKILPLIASGCLMLSGCVSSLQVTHHPLPQESRIPAFETYCWAQGQNQEAIACVAPTGGHHNFFDTTIRAEINESLETQGYRTSPCETADFFIDYRLGVHEEITAVDKSAEDSLHDYGARWTFGKQADIHYEGLAKPEETFIAVQHGTLHIAAFSPAEELLWHSEAHKVLSERDTDATRLKTIRDATDKAMSYFPAKK
jgi:hypothetical protein